MSESTVDRATAFVKARRTRRWLRLTLVIFVLHVLLHLAAFAWALSRYQDLGISVPLARSVFFVVGIPASIYGAAWIVSILIAALWRRSDQGWRHGT